MKKEEHNVLKNEHSVNKDEHVSKGEHFIDKEGESEESNEWNRVI